MSLNDYRDEAKAASDAAEYFQGRYRQARAILVDLAAYDPGGGWDEHDRCIFCEQLINSHKSSCVWARAYQMTRTSGLVPTG